MILVDFFLAFNEMQVLLLTKTRLGLGICQGKGGNYLPANAMQYVLPGLNSV